MRHPVPRPARPRLASESRGNLPYLFFYSALSIPLFYAVGLVDQPRTNFAIADFWRFWVVHLWVEDFLELFTTIMVAYIFVLLGVVSEKTATRVIYFDAILYSVGGVVGTMHHLYFSGTPADPHGPRGVLLRGGGDPADVPDGGGVDVPAPGRAAAGGARRRDQFPHRWAVMFLVSVGFWNFLGAGVFGFLINLPMVSYYEIGTQLTANHGHAAMMGVYGMLADRPAGLLPALPAAAGGLERAAGRLFVLDAEPGAGVDGVRQPVPARRAAAGRRRGERLLARPVASSSSKQHAYIEWLRLPGTRCNSRNAAAGIPDAEVGLSHAAAAPPRRAGGPCLSRNPTAHGSDRITDEQRRDFDEPAPVA